MEVLRVKAFLPGPPVENRITVENELKYFLSFISKVKKVKIDISS